MARMRMVKPSFFTNDTLAELDPLARLLFVGLWCLADRAGRLEDRPKRIRAEILPYDEVDIDALLQALHDKGFILRYTHSGNGAGNSGDSAEHYVQIINFTKHQSPHIKEQASIIPPPDMPGASTVQAPDKHHISPPDAVADTDTDTDTVAVTESATSGKIILMPAPAATVTSNGQNHWTDEKARRTAEEVARKTRIPFDEIPDLMDYIKACPRLSHELIVGECGTYRAWMNRQHKSAQASVFYNKWLIPANERREQQERDHQQQLASMNGNGKAAATHATSSLEQPGTNRTNGVYDPEKDEAFMERRAAARVVRDLSKQWTS